MQSDFAFLEEIWGPETSNVGNINPSCELLKQTKPSIMDAYMAEKDCKDPELKFENRTSTYDINSVEGYNIYDPLYAQQYNYNEYFASDLKLPQSSTIDDTPPVSNITDEETKFTRNDIYKDIVEKYSTPNIISSTAPSYNIDHVELVIFIISGIFLIFFMEQILQLGSKLKLH